MKKLTQTELLSLLDKQECQLVDTKPWMQFDEAHIPGAVNVPVGEDFAGRIQWAVADKRRKIVLCSSNESTVPAKLAKVMTDLGYSQVFHYPNADRDWEKAGHPLRR